MKANACSLTVADKFIMRLTCSAYTTYFTRSEQDPGVVNQCLTPLHSALSVGQTPPTQVTRQEACRVRRTFCRPTSAKVSTNASATSGEGRPRPKACTAPCRCARRPTPYRQKIHSSQFPDQNRPVDGHRSQPDAKSRNQNFGFAPPKPRLNPGQAAAAQGENDQRPALGRGWLTNP